MTNEHNAAPGSAGARQRIEQRFDLVWNPVSIGEVSLILPEHRDPLAYINQRLAAGGDEIDTLPFWTTLWPAAMVLASMVAKAPPTDDGPILELGAGLGLPGLVAAALGRQALITDLEPDALEFAQAAVEANGLEGRARVMALDWAAPPADLGRFRTIYGAEIVYQPKIYPILVDFLASVTAPDGVIFLGHEARPFVPAFFNLAKERFRIKGTRRLINGEAGPVEVILYALKPLDAAGKV
ncbi:Methyltransferase-16, putative [Desulfarculus baarsii DSM 2075]|uniref:Methyltransferase-16, putative n=1 Tax=Desulfarculus baarsii (strain ATCC 33931 / DSM 2075 / LMG 7858 / VKM B-1802 / 2st14) TaxID=644282 RepID=E1QF70_DESB2|nr:methyltransferase [Desulfarculus baarsii]ADK84206.1 Methyltransferase-16, putative [Desulfarculus baarsii DSM 2075]